MVKYLVTPTTNKPTARLLLLRYQKPHVPYGKGNLLTMHLPYSWPAPAADTNAATSKPFRNPADYQLPTDETAMANNMLVFKI